VGSPRDHPWIPRESGYVCDGALALSGEKHAWELISQADVKKTGIRGDRNIVVVSRAGDRVITARTHPWLLGLQAVISSDGETMIEGHSWHSAEALELTRKAVREPVRLIDAGLHTERFDVLPLLVATDGAIDELGLDMRRLRPNIVIGRANGRYERTWPGRLLRSGEVRVAIAQLRMRCVMTTFDPDTLNQDVGVLRRIAKEAGGKLALNCSVEAPGSLRVGDPIELAA
jgi:uncharacterized protein